MPNIRIKFREDTHSPEQQAAINHYSLCKSARDRARQDLHEAVCQLKTFKTTIPERTSAGASPRVIDSQVDKLEDDVGWAEMSLEDYAVDLDIAEDGLVKLECIAEGLGKVTKVLLASSKTR